ncbi:hypothetical protein QBC35DRAFT_449399 [Podospora australis]|uniref:FUN14 family protein n=1 Tax=Podospora australis TaxID=1536484 RepID=A0AAN6WXX0_9PEZI|nr:hypothetical protein QBC35DRAFT_449399 [Podospora australis]
MASRILLRSSLRRTALPVLSLGLTSSLVAIHNQRPVRCDTFAVPPERSRAYSSGKRKDHLDADVVKQLSSGSLSGFVAGVLVSYFSKTLVLLGGITMVLLQVASRYGINLVDQLHLRQRVQSSRILSALNRVTVFKISFAIAFALSAFMSF